MLSFSTLRYIATKTTPSTEALEAIHKAFGLLFMSAETAAAQRKKQKRQPEEKAEEAAAKAAAESPDGYDDNSGNDPKESKEDGKEEEEESVDPTKEQCETHVTGSPLDWTLHSIRAMSARAMKVDSIAMAVITDGRCNRVLGTPSQRLGGEYFRQNEVLRGVQLDQHNDANHENDDDASVPLHPVPRNPFEVDPFTEPGWGQRQLQQ